MRGARTLPLGGGGRGAAVALGVLLGAVPALAQNAPPVKPGFPFAIGSQTTGQSRPIGSHPAVADLGLSTGVKSIVFAIQSGRVYILRKATSPANTWEVAPGWPQTLPAVPFSSPAVGNLDGDAALEIVIGYGWTGTQSTQAGGIRAFELNGTAKWTKTTGDVTPGPANGFADPVMATPAIGDIDGDGTAEVVVGATDHRLYVLNGEDGTAQAGWSSSGLDVGDTVFSSAALFDLDADGKLEIIVGIDRYLVDGGRLLVLRHDGTNFPGFPIDFDQTIVSSPAIGDVDGDGKPEIVHGTGTYYYLGRDGTTSPPLNAVYAWKCDGTALANWPVTSADGLEGQVETAPALANLDGGGDLEVVVTAVKDPTPASYPSGDEEYWVHALKSNGTVLWKRKILDYNILSLSGGNPVVADVFSDSSGLEVLVPTNGEIAVFAGSNGAALTDTDSTGGGALDEPSMMTATGGLAGVVVTDLETDGAGNSIEVIAVNASSHPPSTANSVSVFVWNPGSGTSTPPWGHFRQDPVGRRGIAPGTANCSDENCFPPATATEFTPVTPCRAYDSRSMGSLQPFQNNEVRNVSLRSAPNCTNALPLGAIAAAVNITVTNSTRSGSVALHMGNCGQLTLPTVPFAAGQTRANNAVLPLSLDGQCTLAIKALLGGTGSVHVIVDVNGYFAPTPE